ncbi:variant erythrocyte surface antigen-1, alpha subunit, partial [Babesia divergens]
MTLKVCYMYYTDVFVGTNDIDKLKDALIAELNGSGLNDDLTQLVQGLCLFMGYPSCVCSLKLNVDKSLKDISKKLLKDSEAVQSCVSKPLTLNCSNCIPNDILCKCCVISCIKELRGQSKQSKCNCPRLSNTSQSCQCKEPKEKCCKDFLSGLEACLSLLNLKTDMEDCKCDTKKCCNNGTCTSGCNVCPNSKTLKTPKDYTVTGLGLLRPSPIRLAEKLEKFFGSGGRKGSPPCGCKCGSGSCCCLACKDQDCSSKKSCFCGSTSPCSCASKLKLPKTSGDCPCKTFCSKINSIKVLVGSSEMRCCESGKKCHCGLGSSPCNSGQCCVVSDKSGAGSDVQQSVKCMLRRVVKFFASFDPSKPDCPKLCCEIFCVLKICVFLKMFYDKGNKKSCGKCNGKGGPGGNKCENSKAPSGSCCRGNPSKCKSPQCCLGCQDCDAIKFSRALQKLQYSGPCGLDLYRLLKDLLKFCSNVMHPNQDFIRSTVLEAVKGCSKCGKSGTDSSGWQPCTCSSSDCKACPKLLENSKLKALLRHGYVSSYTYRFVPFADPPAKSTYASWDSLSPGEQRKAAKIFLGMLPCLYYGLKILHARSKYGSGFAGWHDISVSNDKPESALAKFFHAWGYDLRSLKTKKGSEFFSLLDSLSTMKVLEKFSTLVTENYFTSNLISPPKDPKTPSTVRSMLLWLYGLPFTSGFHDLVSHCSSLCSPFGNSFHPDAFCYYIHASCFLLPVAIISLIEDSLSITSLHSEFSKFFYPSDPSDLFEKLCEYARKIFVALAFLYYQCERNAGQGGWNDCAFGRQCAEKFQEISSGPVLSSSPCSCSSSDPSNPSQGYLCTAINKDPVHDHCQKGSCLGFPGSTSTPCSHSSSNGKPCKPCPHPLMRFLIDGSENSKNLKNLESPFQPPEGFPPMGFSKSNLPTPARKGKDLYHDIYGFCKDGFYPLTRLVQFILCVSRYPETLGELFAFFKKFVEALNSKPDLSSRFVQWINGEP